jgi:hypothetical protein
MRGNVMRALPIGALILAGCGGADAFVETDAPAKAANRYEVWVLDQSNSFSTFGGRLYVYDGNAMAEKINVPPIAVVDLAGDTASLCMTETGANPVRPHMIFFNATRSHAIVSFVASGHVVIFNANTRAPVKCIRTSPGAGGARQAHAALPSPDDRYLLVANQNGKLLERIDTDYATNTFTLNAAATINLATCTTPSGALCQDAVLRPDNAPICGIFDNGGSGNAWVTLRGGGLFVVNAAATPMQIVGEYDRATVLGNGCGGIQEFGSIYINSGGGTASNLYQFDLYRFPSSGYSASNPPNTPAPVHVFHDDTAGRDSHGMVLTEEFKKLWAFDRGTNVIEVFDAASNAHEASVSLATAAFPDPTPDIADINHDGDRVFAAMRGPVPLSGDPHVSTGSTPGVMVIQVPKTAGGVPTVLGGVRISNVDATGVERADPHGLRIRRL